MAHLRALRVRHSTVKCNQKHSKQLKWKEFQCVFFCIVALIDLIPFFSSSHSYCGCWLLWGQHAHTRTLNAHKLTYAHTHTQAALKQQEKRSNLQVNCVWLMLPSRYCVAVDVTYCHCSSRCRHHFTEKKITFNAHVRKNYLHFVHLSRWTFRWKLIWINGIVFRPFGSHLNQFEAKAVMFKRRSTGHLF